MRRLCCLLALMAGVLAPQAALAADGEVDPGFGSGGTTLTSFETSAGGEGPGTLMLMGDGRIVAVGSAKGNGFGFARYLANGAPDPAFDGDGIAYVQPAADPAPSSHPADALLGPGGEIIAAGFGDTGGSPFDSYLVQLTSAGQLDPAFGNDPPHPIADGISFFDVGNWDVAEGIGRDSSGRLLTVGRTGTNVIGGANDIYVARINADGAPDLGFGAAGVVKLPLGVDDRGFDMIVLPDDRLLVAAVSDGHYIVLKLLENGAPDPGFGGGDGIATVPELVADESEGARLALEPDGDIVLVGSSGPDFISWQFGVARLLADGSPDPSFAGDGSEVFPVADRNIVSDVAVGDDGKIVVVGGLTEGTNDDAVVVRMLGDGTLDPAFGSGGVVRLGAEATWESAGAVAIQPDRRIVVGGNTFDGANVDGFVTRLLGDTAAPETKITKAPRKPLRAGAKAKLKFKELGDVNASFECKLKRPKAKQGKLASRPARFAACESQYVTKKTKRRGKYRFAVRAIDPAGNVDASPAKKKFRVG